MILNYTSESQFKTETQALINHLKPLKISALRLAIAKANGFRSIQAYVDHLKKVEVYSEDALSAKKKERNEKTFFTTYIDDVFIQAMAPEKVESFSGTEWNEEASWFLSGSRDLIKDIEGIEIEGIKYLRGHLDISDILVADSTEYESDRVLWKAIHHFIRRQGRYSLGVDICNKVFDYLVEGARKGQEDVVRSLNYLHKYSNDIQAFSGETNASDNRCIVVNIDPGDLLGRKNLDAIYNIYMEDSESTISKLAELAKPIFLNDEYLRMGNGLLETKVDKEKPFEHYEQLAEKYLLIDRMCKMLVTMLRIFDQKDLIKPGEDIDPETIKKGIERNKKFILYFLPVAFFMGMLPLYETKLSRIPE